MDSDLEGSVEADDSTGEMFVTSDSEEESYVHALNHFMERGCDEINRYSTIAVIIRAHLYLLVRSSGEVFVDTSSDDELDYLSSRSSKEIDNTSSDLVSFNRQVVEEDSEISLKTISVKCSKNCYNKCGLRVLTFTEDEIVSFKSYFKNDKILVTKNNLLHHLNSQAKLNISVKSYSLKGHSFCTKAFSELTSVSEYILKTVLDEFDEDKTDYTHGNKSVQRESLAVMKFESWLVSFSELYGQYAPDECTIVLPEWLTKASLYRIYIQEVPGPHICQSSFYQLFKDKFGARRVNKNLHHIRISKYSTHSECAQCLAIARFRRSCKTIEDLEYAKSLQCKHRELYGNARRKITEIEQSAITFPEDHILIKIDGMDNRKSDLPRFLENSKQFVNFQKLPSHITGAIVTSGFYQTNEKKFFFINHNQYEQGSNMIVSIIYHLLHDFLIEFKKFPKKLHISADNCGRENKNRYLFSFLSALVQLNVFYEVTMDFLLVGHTGNMIKM